MGYACDNGKLTRSERFPWRRLICGLSIKSKIKKQFRKAHDLWVHAPFLRSYDKTEKSAFFLGQIAVHYQSTHHMRVSAVDSCRRVLAAPTGLCYIAQDFAALSFL